MSPTCLTTSDPDNTISTIREPINGNFSEQDSSSWKVFYKRIGEEKVQTTNKSNRGHKEQNDDQIPRTFQMENLWPDQRSPRDDKFSHNEVSFGFVRDARVIPRFYHHPLWSYHLFFFPPTATANGFNGRKLDGSTSVRFFAKYRPWKIPGM